MLPFDEHFDTAHDVRFSWRTIGRNWRKGFSVEQEETEIVDEDSMAIGEQ
jgi:hypothetical protein